MEASKASFDDEHSEVVVLSGTNKDVATFEEVLLEPTFSSFISFIYLFI